MIDRIRFWLWNRRINRAIKRRLHAYRREIAPLRMANKLSLKSQ